VKLQAQDVQDLKPGRRSVVMHWLRATTPLPSVSRTTARENRLGKVGFAQLGDEGEELIEFFFDLKRIAA
jgi:hypothetical protein